MASEFTKKVVFFQKAIILHPHKNKFLILKRSSKDPIRPNTWDLPGGNVKYKELHRDALEREINEETSLTINNIREAIVVTHYDTKKSLYYFIVGAMCETISDKVVLSKEHSAFKWVTKDDFLSFDSLYTYKEDRVFDINSTDFLRDIVVVAYRFLPKFPQK